MFGLGMIFGGVLGGTFGVVFTALLVAGKREDEQLAAMLEKHSEQGKRICFLDADAEFLFSIPDGDSIELSAGDGQRQSCLCEYVDATYMKIDGKLWHMLDFAQQMKKRGIWYYPTSKYNRKEGMQ